MALFAIHTMVTNLEKELMFKDGIEYSMVLISSSWMKEVDL